MVGADGVMLETDVYSAFRVLFPNHVIPADDLARGMVGVPLRGRAEREARISENRDIRAMVKSWVNRT